MKLLGKWYFYVVLIFGAPEYYKVPKLIDNSCPRAYEVSSPFLAVTPKKITKYKKKVTGLRLTFELKGAKIEMCDARIEKQKIEKNDDSRLFGQSEYELFLQYGPDPRYRPVLRARSKRHPKADAFDVFSN